MIVPAPQIRPTATGSRLAGAREFPVGLVEDIAGIKLKRNYNLDAPKGVNGRNSDNTLIQEKLGWRPAEPLLAGIAKTFEWIDLQVRILKQKGEGLKR